MNTGNQDIDIKNRDKIFFPGEKISKGELIDYYREAGDRFLSYASGRPIMLHRFPDGIKKQGFYHKDRPDYFPEWIHSVILKKEGGTVDMVTIDKVSVLVYLANQGTIAFHGWLSRQDEPDVPDKMVFDLDPPKSGDFKKVVKGAGIIRDFFRDRMDTEVFFKLTGSRGIHVVVPLRRDADFDLTRKLARSVAEQIAGEHDDMLTVEPRKNKRRGRLFLDYLRNGYAQTTILPYSIRPLKGAPVAMPVEWDEIRDGTMKPDHFSMKTALARIREGKDPWKNMMKHGRKVSTMEKEI